MSPPLQITEDTPPDMLAGSMDLCVMLPNGHTIKMSVERSTPMMDLLVQVTTANKISPSGHTIQALGERGVMPYKSSTPIGALDAWTVHIVPKSQTGPSTNRKAPLKPLSQPFEQTFRLQVHLPRNQLYVTRISPKTKLSDILSQVCNEKNLDSSKYSLRHPVNTSQVLNLSYCLADYKLQEVALVSNRSKPLGVSSVDIMSLQQTNNAAYSFNLSRTNRSCDGSMSSGSIGGRSLSPTRSDGSSASPPPVVAPNRPVRKRRPAPKPPVTANNNNINNSNNSSSNNNDNVAINNNNNNNKFDQQSSSQGPQSTVICHSRNSSDSSGYHEASVLSESPESNSLPDSLPRRSKLSSASVAETNSSKVVSNLSRSLSNLTAVGSSAGSNMKSHSISSTSLVSIPGRKKKAAPLPPPLLSKMSSVSEELPKQRTPSVSSTASSSTTLEDNDHNIPRKSSTLPASIRVAKPSSCIPESTESDLRNSNFVVSEIQSSSTLSQETPGPVELPKPKPRTVFRTDSSSSVLSVMSIGDGSSSAKPTTVNTASTLPRKSRKSYPAPAPKPRFIDTNESSNINSSGYNCTKNESSQIQVTSANGLSNIETSNINYHSECDVAVSERRGVSRVQSVDRASLHKSESFDSSPSDFDRESITSSTSSVFVKTEIPDDTRKLKECKSDAKLIGGSNSNKGRNFSVGNLEDVPDFLSKSPQLGRWKNMECLAEGVPSACGIRDNNSESDVLEDEKTDASELCIDDRIDKIDDEIDRIFHNATRDHASLESGVGDEPPVSLLSLPSPPSSLTNQMEASVNVHTENLDWEYKLPAPPTFRDESNSPTVTEFDTVTIGNLTDVFGPESILQVDSKKQTMVGPDIINLRKALEKSGAVSEKLNVENRDKTKLVDSKSFEMKNKENEKIIEESNVDIPNENSIINASVGTVATDNDSSKPDLLKHSIVSERQNIMEKSAVINELSSVINERLNRPEVTSAEIENTVKTKNSDVQQSCALDNFIITTYKETKPIEVFEDDSIKSSNGERRDSSRDEALFRAPKSVPRQFEPNLKRRSSFSSDDKPVNISVKRSMSHVSLLAGNVSRGPYRSLLARSNGALTETARLQEEVEKIGPRLRKTTSEVNISQGNGDQKVDWRTGDSMGLQSLQVLRSILPRLSHSQSCVDSIKTLENEEKQERVTSVSDKKFERTLSENIEISSKDLQSNKRYSYCGPPTINLSTWSERPKRQVSIKMDRDYCSGFGKLKSNTSDETKTKDSAKSNELTNGFPKAVNQQSNSKLDEKPDIIKQSNDSSRVPIVRAVELKKQYSTNNVGMTDFGRCGFFNGRSLENLSGAGNEFKSFNKFNDQTYSHRQQIPSSPTPVYTSSVAITSEISQRSSTDANLNSPSVSEERTSSVTSLAKRFGQAKVRPSSCYLYGTHEKQTNEENLIKSGNTSQVFLNKGDRKYTSIVGINGVENNNNSNNYNSNINNVVNGCSNNNNKTEIKIVQRPQLQTSKVMIGGEKEVDDKTVSFKINGNVYNTNNINNSNNNNNNNNKVDNNLSSDIRALSKISSGGYLEESTKVPRNTVSQVPSLKQNTIVPVVKGFRKPENKTPGESQVPGVGIPPPPPVMPVLKPVGQRKQIKTLPPPEADPRDQLLASIRNFGRFNSLKKVTSK